MSAYEAGDVVFHTPHMVLMIERLYNEQANKPIDTCFHHQP